MKLFLSLFVVCIYYKVFMPRQARVNAPGALHHVMCRGIERRKIFRDNQDRRDFVERIRPKPGRELWHPSFAGLHFFAAWCEILN